MCISVEDALSAPLLEANEERAILVRWQRFRDHDAAEMLLRSHARMVHAVANRWRQARVDTDDLISAGMHGLLIAAEQFDLSQNVRFSTYARWWIQTMIQTEAVRSKATLSVPVNKARDAASGRLSTEIADAARMALAPAATLDDTSVDAEGLRLADRLASETPSPEESLLSGEEAINLREALNDAIETLPDPARQIMVMRAEPDPPTRREIAYTLDLTEAQVQDIQDNAHLRLRRVLIDRGLTPMTLW